MTTQDDEDRRTAMACLGIHPSWSFADLTEGRQLDVALIAAALAGAREEGRRAAEAKVDSLAPLRSLAELMVSFYGGAVEQDAHISQETSVAGPGSDAETGQR